MIDAIQPRLQAWVEAFLATELPQVARVCFDRTVREVVDEHVWSAISPLSHQLLPALVQFEVVLVQAFGHCTNLKLLAPMCTFVNHVGAWGLAREGPEHYRGKAPPQLFWRALHCRVL